MGTKDVPEKVEIARENWYQTDCKGLSAAVIKDAYERGFNRAYHLLKTQATAQWHTERHPMDGSVCIVDIGEDNPVLLVAVITEGMFMYDEMDLSPHVKRWLAIPGIKKDLCGVKWE